MEQVIQIQKLGQYRLDNALHFRFHSLVCQEVHAADAEKIGIPQALLDEYQACVDDEADAIKEVVEVTETKKITRKDSECDRRLSFILGMVRIMRLSPRAEEAEAAEQLYLITRMKKRIQIEGQGRKAARIWSLLTDLKKPEAAAWLTLLRLNEAVDLLEKTNNEAERLQAQRTSIQGEKKSRPSFTKIRPRTDKVYHDVLLRLQFAKHPSIAQPSPRWCIASTNSQIISERPTNKASHNAAPNAAPKKSPQNNPNFAENKNAPHPHEP